MISEIIQTAIIPIEAFFGHAERKFADKIIVGPVLKNVNQRMRIGPSKCRVTSLVSSWRLSGLSVVQSGSIPFHPSIGRLLFGSE
jgi:hypothetical protein